MKPALAPIILVALGACGAKHMKMGDDDGMPDAASDGSSAMDGAAADGSTDAMPGPPTAAQLLARIATCDQVIGGTYAKDSGGTSNISICGLPNAVFWKSDLDVDCDGKVSAQCNSSTDPSFQNQTAATDSLGNPLDAAALPYVVVPGHSTRWDYRTSGLAFGSVFVVIYNNKLAYGVFGDIGPTSIIGEASYAMAASLGIDPDPSTGGVDSGVAFIGFSGPSAVVSPIEDHNVAVTVGIAHAQALLAH